MSELGASAYYACARVRFNVSIPYTNSYVSGRQHALVHSLGEIAERMGVYIDAGISLEPLSPKS